MLTLGIDLSSQPAGTAACRIRWSADGDGRADEPVVGCDDGRLDALIAGIDAVGIDAPFGWPREFRRVLVEWTDREWTTEARDRLRFRATDRFVHELGLQPLSVSTDKIALPAMRAMALLARRGVTDHSGDGRFFEVYPAASLKVWGLPHQGYKGKKAKAADLRARILDGLRSRFAGLECADSYRETDHALDGLVAAMTARQAKLGRTRPPDADGLDAARDEGWIHVPVSLHAQP